MLQDCKIFLFSFSYFSPLFSNKIKYKQVRDTVYGSVVGTYSVRTKDGRCLLFLYCTLLGTVGMLVTTPV